MGQQPRRVRHPLNSPHACCRCTSQPVCCGSYFHRGYLGGDSWLFENPFAPPAGHEDLSNRLTDDEIANAISLIKMAEYARGGPEFYSVAQASQDR